MRSLDLRTQPLDDVLDEAGRRLGTELDRDCITYSERDGATIGARTHRGTWSRIQYQDQHDTPARWDAEETAAAITGVCKPCWYQAVSWSDTARGVEWRGDEIELITAPVLGGLTGLLAEPGLTDLWWARLRGSLTALADQATDRQALDQDTLTRSITRVFGDRLDTTITEWSTAHGDLHWGNLTADATLLDWEAWGTAPRGLDAAELWGMALPYPDIAERVQREFAEDLTTRSGRLVQLMWCATAIRAASKRGDLDHYLTPARTAAQLLLTKLEQSAA